MLGGFLKGRIGAAIRKPFAWLWRTTRTPFGLVAAIASLGFLVAVLGFFVAGFLKLRVESAERARLYAVNVIDNGMDWLDRTVRGEAAVRDQRADWEPVKTALHDLDVNVIALKPTPIRAGAMTQLADKLLLTVSAHGDFVTLDPDTARVLQADIASPLNLDTFRADPLWKTPGLTREFFRINDILALRTGEKDYDLYATHHWFTPSCIQWRLSKTKIRVEDGRVRQVGDGWKTTFEARPCFQVMTEYSAFYLPWSGNLSGGRMLDYDSGRLLVTVGDLQAFEARGVDVAQDPNATLGRFLLIDKNTGAATVFATGSRNAQGLLRDSRGRLWSTEHGPMGGDELNLVQEGDNLGWPFVTYGVNYDQRPWPGTTHEGGHEGYKRPVHAWVPSIGISNLVEAPGDAFPNWKGDLLVASLRAKRLYRVHLEGDEPVYAEEISLQLRGLRDIEVLPDGRLAVLDNRMSMILVRNGAGFGKSLRYNDKSLVAPKVATNRLGRERAQQVSLGETLYARRCGECHSLTYAGAVGPQLRNVVGRNIGSESGFAYSEALLRAPGNWTEQALTRWLMAPESFGDVAMPNQELEKPEAEAIAAYLAEMRRQDRRRPEVVTGAR